jgi:CheY-like chemotaxis protein
MIVEDDAGMQVMLGMALEDAGYAVAQAANGAEALDLLRQQRPNLILLDMRMPVMDGPAFVRHLRAQPGYAPPPIVAMTAYRELDPELAALGIPWISKPMRLDALIELIKTNI